MRGLKTSVNIFKRAADGWYRVQRGAHFIVESTHQKLRSCLERAEGSYPISIILGVTLTISTPSPTVSVEETVEKQYYRKTRMV